MRAKIILPNLLAVFLLGVGVYFYLQSALRANADEKLRDDISVVSSLFVRSEALRGHEQLSEVQRLSMSRSVIDVFSELKIVPNDGESEVDFKARVQQAWFKKAFKAVETASVSLEQRGRTPSLLFVTDRNGVVLARNTTPNACPAGRNVADGLAVVERALDGEASYSIWSTNDSPFDKKKQGANHLCSLMNTGLLELSAAPVWGLDDQVVGTIVVGYEVSNGMAAEKSETLGLELAVVHAGQVYSTSFTTDTARQNLNEGLGAKSTVAKLDTVFRTKSDSEMFDLTVEGESYLALATPVVNAAGKDKVAFIFMGSVAQSNDFAGPLSVMLGLVCGALLLIIIIGFLLGSYFMKPILAIEEGLLKIINGAHDHRFDVESEEVGGLSYRINQLVNVFTEQEENPDEDS